MPPRAQSRATGRVVASCASGRTSVISSCPAKEFIGKLIIVEPTVPQPRLLIMVRSGGMQAKAKPDGTLFATNGGILYLRKGLDLNPGCGTFCWSQPNDPSTPMAKPILFSVDDDSDVLRAIERDLRSQYGADYRVIGSDSPEGALDLLRQLKVRNDSVALLLADQRMPRMNGVEFLQQGMRIFPEAKRAL